MDFLGAFILGVIEGITEFLPISSTGHLILAANLLKIQQTEFVKTFEVVIQSGAILAVVVIYYKRIISNFDLLKRIFAAFIPTAVIGFTLFRFIKESLIGNPEVVLASLLVGGVALIGVELMFARRESRIVLNEKRKTKDETPSYERAFVIGLFQSLSVIPGVSRAASTIIGGMLVGLNRKTAVEFSFLLAIPTMAAATLLDLRQTSINFSSYEWTLLFIGFATSFLVALIVIKWLVKYVETNNFILFGVYRIALSVVYFLFFMK